MRRSQGSDLLARLAEDNGQSSGYQYTKAGRLSTTLQKSSRSIPKAGDGEVVVKIKAMALNPVDQQLANCSQSMLSSMGAKQPAPSPQTPWIPGLDFSGVVHEAGKDSKFSVGDEVYGMKSFADLDGQGTLQQYVKLPSFTAIVKKPSNLSWTEAAAIPLVYMTVYDALVNYGKLSFRPQPAQTAKRSILILGGSSGTGSVAIQMAKKMGLKIVTTCSGKNVDFVTRLGADEVIDYTTENVWERSLNSAYAPYAMVFDCVGGKDLLSSLDHLLLNDSKAPELGIYVTIVGDKTGRDEMGGAAGNSVHPQQGFRQWRSSFYDSIPNWIPLKSWITGRRYVCMSLIPSKEIMETIPEFLESAKDVIIDSTWNFEQAKQAYAKLESSRAKGKVVITVDTA